MSLASWSLSHSTDKTSGDGRGNSIYDCNNDKKDENENNGRPGSRHRQRRATSSRRSLSPSARVVDRGKSRIHMDSPPDLHSQSDDMDDLSDGTTQVGGGKAASPEAARLHHPHSPDIPLHSMASFASGESAAGPSRRPGGETQSSLRRREANRLAAQRFRSRKKGYQDSLEERIRQLEDDKRALIVQLHGPSERHGEWRSEDSDLKPGSQGRRSPSSTLLSQPLHSPLSRLAMPSSNVASASITASASSSASGGHDPRDLFDGELRIAALESANRKLQDELRSVKDEKSKLQDQVAQWRRWAHDHGADDRVHATPAEHAREQPCVTTPFRSEPKLSEGATDPCRSRSLVPLLIQSSSTNATRSYRESSPYSTGRSPSADTARGPQHPQHPHQISGIRLPPIRMLQHQEFADPSATSRMHSQSSVFTKPTRPPEEANWRSDVGRKWQPAERSPTRHRYSPRQQPR